MVASHICCVFLYVIFVWLLFCFLHLLCVCVWISIAEVPFDSADASGLPYYCAPRVCVPVVIGGLVVWWYKKPRSRKTFKWWAAAASRGSWKSLITGWPRALCINVLVRMLIIFVLSLPLPSPECVITLFSAEVHPTWMSPSPKICARVCAHVKYPDDYDWFSYDLM